ncbi:hypothetical protein [Cryobacterium psychrophilum]|uniref:Uncharacterized protein n=1 Tax=Cryobacterium psychrophilum TaxID=41988 RepID=A0A4Y8KS68_9MICO|nr:hypothetical protein [Cryobacterium psychrophilum]TDW31460.1 hypothetical protein EDD25_3275 [Cryobacterium psychrophilum]TFD78894.1 hypothetical protein E3T53_08915 [Cryobacterium psychrophilum]
MTILDESPPVITREEARARAFDLVGRAIRLQLWVMVLDARGHQLPLLIPIDDIPARPEPGDLATAGASMCALVSEYAPGGSVILILERPGAALLTAADREWCVELASAFALVRITGIFVAHDDGVGALES